MNAEYQEALGELKQAVALYDDQIRLVTLCSGILEDGREYYAYIHLKASKIADIKAAQENGENISLIEYGDIISAGDGLTPPEDIRLQMEEEYNIDYDFMQKTFGLA